MFDDIIKDKANNHEAKVPPDAWDNIINKKKKRRFAFFWWSSILLLVGGLSVAGYLLSNNKNSNTIIAAAESNAAPADKKSNSNKIVPPVAIQDNTSVKNKEQQPVTSSNEEPAITKSGQLKNNTTALNADDNTVKRTGKKTLHTSKSTLLASNSGKKKSFKGRATYNSSPAAPEEITTGIENKNPVVSINGTATTQQDEITNSVADNAAKNSSPPAIEKPAAAVTEEKKKTVTAATETNKENKTLTKQPGKHHWFIDAGITPLLPVQQYDENIAFNRTLVSNNNLSIFSAKLVNTSIDPSMAFSVALRRTFSKKITLGLGLQYLLLKENINISGKETNTQYNVVQRLVNGTNGPELINDTVATVTEGTRNITAVNSYQLYSIPVFIQYNLVQKRSWNLSGVAGVYINISSSYQNEINRNAAAALTAAPAATTNTNIGYDLIAGLRFGKTVGSKVEFFAMPSMRWNLNRFNIKNSLLRKTINQAGLSVGISYKVK